MDKKELKKLNKGEMIIDEPIKTTEGLIEVSGPLSPTNLQEPIKDSLRQLERLNDYDSGEFILDISVLPFLHDILNAKPRAVWIPDTLYELLVMAKKKPQYSKVIERLLRRWTRRRIDVEFLSKVISERKFQEVEIRLITLKDVDRETYYSFSERIIRKDLVIEFSRSRNLLGDIVGKIIGCARKTRRPILMGNRALTRMARRLVPIFDTFNILVDIKMSFLERNLHLPVRRTRGARWILGIVVGVVLSPLGLALAVLDC